MRVSLFTLFSSLLSATVVGSSPVTTPRRSVDSALFDELFYYYKYASSTYVDCTKPLNNTMVKQFSDSGTDTQGFVARDDAKKEIIVAWRGRHEHSSVKDFLLTDASVLLKSWQSPGVSPPENTKVHAGFQRSWNAVADQVISLVKDELSSHEGYSVVSTGHSLGGSLASLAGVSLKSNFVDVPMRLYTYGQPRTGNQEYANFVNEKFGENSFRYVRTIDGVPTAFPTFLGYKHHGVEYWQESDPAEASSLKKCSPDGEDKTCSASKFSNGFTPYHLYYFGLKFDTPFCG